MDPALVVEQEDFPAKRTWAGGSVDEPVSQAGKANVGPVAVVVKSMRD